MKASVGLSLCLTGVAGSIVVFDDKYHWQFMKACEVTGLMEHTLFCGSVPNAYGGNVIIFFEGLCPREPHTNWYSATDNRSRASKASAPINQVHRAALA